MNRPATLEADGAVQTVQDNLLDFGDLFFAHGSAFACSGAESSRPASTPAKIRLPDPQEKTHTPVVKEWHAFGDHSILVEAVCWPDLEPSLAALPEMADSGPMPKAKERLLCLGEAVTPVSAGSHPAKPIEVASREYRPTGVVLDYTIIWQSGGDYVFYNGATYYIQLAFFGGHVVFGAPSQSLYGPVLKFEPGAFLLLYGTVECLGGGGIANIVLTSRDDDLLGERLDGFTTHTPTYAANPALRSYFPLAPMHFKWMRIRWAQSALWGTEGSLRFSKMEMCYDGRTYAPFEVVNSWKCGVVMSSGLIDDCPGDYDSDGLSDVWECQYFGSKTIADPNADSDGDCTTNFEEYNAQSNPHDFPEFATSPPPETVLHTGDTWLMCIATSVPCARWQWYRKSSPSGTFSAIPGATTAVLQIDNLSMEADCGFYMVQVMSDWATNESNVIRLYVNDDFWQAVWDSYQAYDAWQENSYHVWAQKSRPPGWPTVKPLLAWNANTVLSRFANRSAIAGDMWYGWGSGTERIAYVAFSRRHALFRGHGTGNHCFLKPEWAGRKVWFCPADNSQVIEVTITNGYTLDRAYCPNENEDYSIVIFNEDLTNSIVPVKVMEPPPGYSLLGHVNFFGPPDDTNIGVWIDQYYGAGTGASGSPKLIPAPYPDNSLILVGAVDQSNVSLGWQTVMDILSKQQGLDTNAYQLTWYSYSP